MARSLLARQSHSNFPRSGAELDFDCTRSIDREDVSKPTLLKSTKRRKVKKKNNGKKWKKETEVEDLMFINMSMINSTGVRDQRTLYLFFYLPLEQYLYL